MTIITRDGQQGQQRPYAGFTATCEIRFHAQFKVNFIACIEKNADLLEHFAFDNKQKLSLEKLFFYSNAKYCGLKQ